MIGIILATVIMAVYLGWYLYNYGVPGSISRTVYKLPHESIFTLVMYAVAFLTVIPMMNACSENTKVLAFLTMGSIGFVGAAPLGKHCDERVHMSAAAIFGVCSQIMIAINAPALLLMWLLFLFVFIILLGRNWLFWAELVCIATLFAFCLLPYVRTIF